MEVDIVFVTSVPSCSSGNMPDFLCEFSALGLCDLDAASPNTLPQGGGQDTGLNQPVIVPFPVASLV